MSVTITPYLFFSGRCQEAIDYYSKSLGAKLEFSMRFSDSPDPTPPGMLEEGFDKKIMHASIRIGGAVVMMSDGCDSKGKFEGFKLALNYPTAEEATKAFNALADGGKVELPLTKTFWSPLFGMVVDRFGMSWMVSIPEEPK